MSGRSTAIGLCFDDVLIQPRYSEVLPQSACLNSRIGPVTISIPLVSAAMDTVTEKDMAIALAKEGGLGFIHKNMSIDEQARQVLAVKKYEAGVVLDPMTVTPDMTLSELKDIIQKTGFNSYPVIDSDRRLLGLVTAANYKYVRDPQATVNAFMTQRHDVVTVTRFETGTPTSSSKSTSRIGDFISPTLQFTTREIQDMMFDHKTERIIVVDEEGRLAGMLTMKDFQKSAAQPNAARDSDGRLRVGAAVGCSEDTMNRVESLMEAGVDVILVDSSHGHSEGVLSIIRKIKKAYPKLPVVGGNVCTAEGALALAEAGADCVKCGVGPGSICTTRIVTGVGCPQFSAILACSEALKPLGVPLIADGGIRYSGDLAKALAAGASAVMVGSLLAGSEETPGTTELVDGRVYKTYRGMGSLGAMEKGSADRYFQSGTTKFVPEGVEGYVPYKGPVKDTIYQLMGGLRSCMGLTGCKNLQELATQTTFVQVTGLGLAENHPHNILMVKEPPNYTRPKGKP